MSMMGEGRVLPKRVGLRLNERLKAEDREKCLGEGYGAPKDDAILDLQ